MASWRGRYINPWKWEDEWHMSLGRDEQKLFDYLLDSPRSAGTLIGVYELNLQVAAFHTKIDLAEVKAIFKDRLAPDGKAFFEVGWVILPNWLKHQHFNENMFKSAANEFNDLPEFIKLLAFNENSPSYIDLPNITNGVLVYDVPDMKGLRTVNYDSERFAALRNAKTKGNRNRNLERELEKEGEREGRPRTVGNGSGTGRRSPRTVDLNVSEAKR